LRVLLAACILALPGAARAQESGSDSAAARSTRAGVYSAAQAARGREIYLLNCVSCHTPASHAGPEFVTKWDGKSLAELFDYIRTSMPKSDPGVLSRREYVNVLAYLLRMNGMPAGAAELAADSTRLRNIRLDLKTARDSTP
jgi:mono/diheme cytochrome c family protein